MIKCATVAKKELLSQSFEVLQMWYRHTQLPFSEIAIVSMVSVLFPWHFSGIIWHPGGMLWNAMEFHGIQKIAIVSMVSMLFPWHFSVIIWHPCGMRWNAMEFHGIQKNAIVYDLYAISMALQWNSMASRCNVVECHGIPWDIEDCHTLTGRIRQKQNRRDIYIFAIVLAFAQICIFICIL